jgi:hypothetical protein
VAGVGDPIAAVHVLEGARTVEVLVTRVAFGSEGLHGVTLAGIARMRRPSVRVVFIGLPELAIYTSGLGEFLSQPAPVADLVTTVARMLTAGLPGP